MPDLAIFRLTTIVLAVACYALSTAQSSAQCTPEQIAKLVASDGAAQDHFGQVAAISGDTAIVGAPHNDHPCPGWCGNSGAAYVFRKVGESWWQVAKLTPNDAEPFGEFGASVAIYGNTAMIAAKYNASGGGGGDESVYVFREIGGTWQQIAKLQASDWATSDAFGNVSLYGSTAVIGAAFDDDGGTSSGSAYVFREIDGSWVEIAKLTASDASANDWFGSSVSISGDTIIVGARFDDDACPTNSACNSGSAYVFREVEGVWQQIAKLTAGDGVQDDNFGTVALDGTTAIIGASGDDDPGTNGGSAYVFREIDGVWEQVAKLLAADGATNDRFGAGVSIHDNVAIIGAGWNDDHGNNSGSAYVFREVEGTWQQTGKFTASDAAAGDEFGFVVSLSGDQVIAGVSRDDAPALDSGSAYIFEINLMATDCNTNGIADECDLAVGTSPDCNINGTPDECDIAHGIPTELTTLAGDAPQYDKFGVSASIYGQTAVIGAEIDNSVGLTTGAAYVFRQIGDEWQRIAKLIASDAAPDDRFGHSVFLHGDTIVVGAYLDDDRGNSSGSAYVFREISGTWQQIAKLTPSETSANAQWGWSVALSGDTAIIGAWNELSSSGSVYVFRETAGAWHQIAKLRAADAATGDRFGWSVSLDEGTAVIGAPNDDDGGADSGSAYVFGEIAGLWQQLDKLTPADPSDGSAFGTSVSLDGLSIIVGAIFASVAPGAAYVFQRFGDDWHQVGKLVASDATYSNYFGQSVSIMEDTAVIGAIADSERAPFGGAAYVFRKINANWKQTAKFAASNAGQTAFFGSSVATSGALALIGAPQAGFNSGTATLFELDLQVYDCNANGIPDDCDLAIGTSADCNLDAVPDECHPDFDADGIIDDCDGDIDNDGVPNEFDACNYTPLNAAPGLIEPNGVLLGDLDGDCDVDNTDYAEFAACMAGPGVALAAECAAPDLDLDSDADLADFAIAQERFTGPN